LNWASGGQLARTGPALLQLQRQYGNRYVQRVVSHAREGGHGSPVQKGNHTGLPDRLKAGIEDLSGLSLDDVHVHYNSSKPARLQALAYTQGTDIHVGPGQGQEKHLAHEAWHVVQQAQGRVKPTMQAKGVAINDDAALEKEADVMGQQAGQSGWTKSSTDSSKNPGTLRGKSSLTPFAPTDLGLTVQRNEELVMRMPVIQRLTEEDWEELENAGLHRTAHADERAFDRTVYVNQILAAYDYGDMYTDPNRPGYTNYYNPRNGVVIVVSDDNFLITTYKRTRKGKPRNPPGSWVPK
jgi:hypothetical protein